MKLFALLSFLLSTTPLYVFVVTADTTQGSSYQFTNDEDGSYASAIQFDAATQTFFVTGSTFGQAFDNEETTRGSYLQDSYRCFVVEMKGDLQVQWQQSIGHVIPAEYQPEKPQDVSQACTDVMLHLGHVYVAGHSGDGDGGAMAELFDPNGLLEKVRYGTLMDLKKPTTAVDQPYVLIGGVVLEESAAVYPVSIDSSPGDDMIYVASMTTDQIDKNTVDNTMDPNLYLPVGNRDILTIEGYKPVDSFGSTGNPLEETFEKVYRKFYRPGNSDTVYVAGIVKVNAEVVVIAGHTKGQGRGFGKSYHSTNVQEASPTWDGFITKFKENTGDPVIDTDNALESTYRVESTDKGAEQIWGVCAHGHGQQSDRDHVYVVGSTTGNVERDDIDDASSSSTSVLEAFLIKLEVGTMQPVWKKQLGVMPGTNTNNNDSNNLASTVEGISCAVTRDGQHVYWAGHVSNGIVENAQDPRFYGGTDIFVSMVDAEQGNAVFVQQIGSDADDTIARRGGLAVDMDGNALLVGNTHGSMYDVHPNQNDSSGDGNRVSNVFVLSVTKEGKFDVPIAHPDHENHIPSDKGYVPPEDRAPAKEEETVTPDNDDKSMSFGVILLVIALIAAGVIGAMYVHSHNHQEAHTDRSKVLRYLNSFDVEDVDLKHSATGGWHCSYANDLAQGKHEPKTPSPRNGGGTTSPSMTAPLTEAGNTSPREDGGSLFSDEADTPSYGDGTTAGFDGHSHFNSSASNGAKASRGIV